MKSICVPFSSLHLNIKQVIISTCSLLFFLLCETELLARQNSIDSLLNVYEQVDDDSLKFDIVKSLSIKYRQKNSDSAGYFAEEYLQMSQKIGDSARIGRGYLYIANALLYGGKYKNALNFYDSAITVGKSINDLVLLNSSLMGNTSLLGILGERKQQLEKRIWLLEICRQLGDSLQLGSALIDVGSSYIHLSQPQKGATYLDQAEAVLAPLGDKNTALMLNLYLVKGDLYWDVEGNSVKAIQMYQKGIELPVSDENIFFKISLLYNLASLHNENGEPEKALTYLLEAVAIYHEKGMVANLDYFYNQLGSVYQKLHEPAKSKYFYRRAFEFALERNQSDKIASTGATLAYFYEKENKKDSSAFFFNHAMRNIDLEKEGLITTTSLFRLGQLQVLRENTKEGERFLKLAFQRSKNENLTIRVEIADELSSLYERQNRFKEAYRFEVLGKSLNDSLYNRDQIRKVAQVEAEFDHKNEILEKENEVLFRDNQITQLEAKRRNTNILILFLSVVVLMIIVFVIVIARFKLKAKSAETRSLKEISQFKESMTGMIAHDLKNPLSVILSGKNIENNQQVARQMLLLVNNMLDVSKLESNKMVLNLTEVDLNKLLQKIETQLSPLLEQSNQKLVVNFQAIYRVQADPSIIERVLINLISNAMKFSSPNQEIIVKGFTEGSKLRISVTDHGRGIAKEDQQYIFESFGQAEARSLGGVGSTGLGLTFCKLAVEAHGSPIHINSEPGKGTTFFFDLELMDETLKESTSSTATAISISDSDQKKIKDQIDQLRQYNLYQIGEIEAGLKTLNGVSPQVDDWVEEVLNAAYSGNTEKYEELLEL